MIKYTDHIQSIPQAVPWTHYVAGGTVFGLICVVTISVCTLIILIMRQNDLDINARYEAIGKPEGDGFSVFFKRYRWLDGDKKS